MSTAGLVFLGLAILLIVIALHGSAANVCTVITGNPCPSLGDVTVSTTHTIPTTPITTIPTGPNRNTGSGPNYNMFYAIHGAS